MIKFDAEGIITRLKDLAHKNGESTNQALKLCGFKDLVVNMRKGSVPSVEKFFVLANHFDVPIGYILIGDSGQGARFNDATISEIETFENFLKLSTLDQARVSERISMMLEISENATKNSHSNIKNFSKNAQATLRKIRVFDDAVSAGLGNYLSADNTDHGELLSFPESEVPIDADFGIRISGDSMQPAIVDGQIVWVSQKENLHSGQIGIFILNGDAYCKQLKVDAQNKRGALISLNKNYDPIAVSDTDFFKTVGKVLL